MNAGQTSPGRRYAGLEAAQRHALRRSALVAAGLELFGTFGYHQVSVKQVCDRAGLTQRYFYESFADREALLLAVYDDAVGTVRANTLVALAPVAADPGSGVLHVATAGLGAFVDCLTGDERLARVVLLEVVGVNAVLEQRRTAVIHEFAGLIRAVAMDRFGLPADDERLVLAAVALVGATTQLLVDWVAAPQDRCAPGTITAVMADLFEAAFERLSR